MLPVESSPTDPGLVNSPSPVPVTPNAAVKPSAVVRTCTRLLPVSETTTAPVAEIAIDDGLENWRFPEPLMPADARNAPEELNF